MLELGSGIQVVLQTEMIGGEFKCEGFDGIPVVNPCFIAVATSGSRQSLQWAAELRRELALAIFNLSATCRYVDPMPCRGVSPGPMGCHAHRKANCRKLLVLVGDATDGFRGSSRGVVRSWPGSDPKYAVLPVLPAGANVQRSLPRRVRHINAAFWQNSVVQVIPSVLAAVGLAARDFKVFVSYRRAEAQALSDQLFDALSRENFDVFLDRFRIDPGIDFQARLTQELADKAMVLILESPGILQSPWTRYEANFALMHRLGVLALNVPGGTEIDDIDSNARMALTAEDLRRRRSGYLLKKAALRRVVDRVKQAHGEALFRRREYLRGNMCAALTWFGVSDQRIGSEGLLHARSRGGRRPREYAVWLTPRPPHLDDFYLTDVNRSRPAEGVVVGPVGSLENLRRTAIEWLANSSGVRCFDETQILTVASGIAGGTL